MPTWLPDGVPEIVPDEVLNEAQVGLFWTENVSAVVAGALVPGLNEYAVPAVTCVAGRPRWLGLR